MAMIPISPHILFLLLCLSLQMSEVCWAKDPPQTHNDGLSRHLFLPDLGDFTPLPLTWTDGIQAAVQRFEDEEQTCLSGNSPWQQTPLVERQKNRLGNIGRSGESLYLEVGILESAPPPKWDLKQPAEMDNWQKKILAADEKKRCQLLLLAYLFAIWQVSTLEPTVALESANDIFIKDGNKPTEDVILDRRRAAWAFRFANAFPEQSIPKDCRKVYDEASLRRAYIFTDRRPLGYAFGACARPMNAHYLDDAVAKKQRPMPEGWKR